MSSMLISCVLVCIHGVIICPDKLTKDKKYVHLGASPFLYADALVPRQDRKGTCIFLPKLDVATGVDFNMFEYEAIRTLVENAPKPVVAMAPAEQKGDWYYAFYCEGLVTSHRYEHLR